MTQLLKAIHRGPIPPFIAIVGAHLVYLIVHVSLKLHGSKYEKFHKQTDKHYEMTANCQCNLYLILATAGSGVCLEVSTESSLENNRALRASFLHELSRHK